MDDHDSVRTRLEARRDELESLMHASGDVHQPIAPDRALGRLTRQDALQQQQMSAALLRRYQQELGRVQRALASLANGTFGKCRRCGEPISPARLRALPDASLCLDCADR